MRILRALVFTDEALRRKREPINRIRHEVDELKQYRVNRQDGIAQFGGFRREKSVAEHQKAGPDENIAANAQEPFELRGLQHGSEFRCA